MRPCPQRIFYFAWVLTLLLLPACSPDKNHADDLPGNVLRIDVDYDFGPFNPYAVDCSGSTYVFPFIYSFLCVPNPDGELEPDLADRWDYDTKTFTWRIELHKNAKFHNGDPVTAADVVFSLRSHFENRNKCMGNINGDIQARGKYVVEIRMKQNSPDLLNNLYDTQIIPDPDLHGGINLDKPPVGSGPFKFEGRTDDGGVILSANENYYRGRPAIDRVVFYYIPDRETSWVRLIKGETDIVGDLAIKDYQIIEQYAGRFYFSKSHSNSSIQYYSVLLYNTRHPLFENPMVRRALTHAVDREFIVQKMLNGMAEVVAGPMGNHSPFHDPDLKPLDYDPTLALELLTKAGWTTDPRTQYLMKNGQFFEFEMLLPSGDETGLRVARYVQLCLNDVGIRAHLKAIPIDELNKRYYQNTDFDATITELSASPRSSEEVLQFWVKTKGTLPKAGGFDSSEAARLADLILAAKDPNTKKSFFREFDRLIADLQPGSFLYQRNYIDAISKRFKLNHPFSYDYPGFYWLKDSRLRNDR